MQDTVISLTLFAVIVIIVLIATVIMMFGFYPRNKKEHWKKDAGWTETHYPQNANIKEPQKEAVGDAQIQNFQKVKVEHIIDGDTVIVSTAWDKIKIRLDSIDCPEGDQHWGDIATFGLIKLIGGREVHIEDHGLDLDPYERTLATIYVKHGYGSEWINVNERMVTLGHAWVMRRFYKHLPKDRQDQLNRLERWARSKKVGLWKTQKPIPPWKWRSEG